MPEEMIYKTIEAYANAAAFAKQCGFGMVTIHGGHGWLLSQFLSPKVNKRKDRWGGSRENRMRFPLAVISAIRKKTGSGFPIEIRISGSEVTPKATTLTRASRSQRHLTGMWT
jgi:2,4-dienoyl-CoA reductase-like NADH-dependent reductase (Old Yellow Enzyme family)